MLHRPVSEKLEADAGLTAWLTRCHRKCDALWSAVEESSESGQTQAAQQLAVAAFCKATRSHLDLEEGTVFPALEAATGSAGFGPSAMMRREHQQMRGLMTQIELAAESGAIDQVLDLGDTLLMFTQQHNAKEEAVLYPMSEQLLTAEWPAIHARMIS